MSGTLVCHGPKNGASALGLQRILGLESHVITMAHYSRKFTEVPRDLSAARSRVRPPCRRTVSPGLQGAKHEVVTAAIEIDQRDAVLDLLAVEFVESRRPYIDEMAFDAARRPRRSAARGWAQRATPEKDDPPARTGTRYGEQPRSRKHEKYTLFQPTFCPVDGVHLSNRLHGRVFGKSSLVLAQAFLRDPGDSIDAGTIRS